MSDRSPVVELSPQAALEHLNAPMWREHLTSMARNPDGHLPAPIAARARETAVWAKVLRHEFDAPLNEDRQTNRLYGVFGYSLGREMVAFALVAHRDERGVSTVDALVTHPAVEQGAGALLQHVLQKSGEDAPVLQASPLNAQARAELTNLGFRDGDNPLDMTLHAADSKQWRRDGGAWRRTGACDAFLTAKS